MELKEDNYLNAYKNKNKENSYHNTRSFDYFSPYEYQVSIAPQGIRTVTLPHQAKKIKAQTRKAVLIPSAQAKLIKASVEHSVFSPVILWAWLLLCVGIGFALVTLLLASNISTRLAFPTMTSIDDNIRTRTSLVVLPNEQLQEDVEDGAFSEVQLSTYTLQSGDFLLNIAKEYNVTIDSIISWNNIQDARRVRAGDDIMVPSRSGILHVVKRGESIESIANKYKIKATSILDTNNLQSSVITVGAKLFLPEARMDKFQLDLVLGNVFLSPARGYISSGYGYRTSPISGKWMFHGAVDIANSVGTRIYAATYGRVSYVAYGNPTYGNMIVMTHASGFQTLYAHLHKIYVKKGQYINRGNTIGSMGSTGLSTGPHLHFAIIQNGKTINPMKYIRVYR